MLGVSWKGEGASHATNSNLDSMQPVLNGSADGNAHAPALWYHPLSGLELPSHQATWGRGGGAHVRIEGARAGRVWMGMES